MGAATLLDSSPEPFDKTNFLRKLKQAAIEVSRPGPGADADASAGQQRVEHLFDLIKEAKREASAMPAEDRAGFIAVVDKVSRLGMAGEATEPAAEPPKEHSAGKVFSFSFDVSHREHHVHRHKEGEPTWRMINLAIHSGEGASHRVIGIAEMGEAYYIFDGEMGDAYRVVQAAGIREARVIFSEALARGYREVSPGAYGAVRHAAGPMG